MSKKLLAPFLGIAALLTFTNNAFAQDWNSIAPDCLQNVKDANGNTTQIATLACIPAVFKNIINAAMIFAGVVALFFIILSGIKMITSGGDQKQLEGARKTLTWAIVGLVIIFLSFFIINVIAGITGVSCIMNFGFENCK